MFFLVKYICRSILKRNIKTILTQQKSNMFTSHIHNKTKSTHFENLDVLVYFHSK